MEVFFRKGYVQLWHLVQLEKQINFDTVQPCGKVWLILFRFPAATSTKYIVIITYIGRRYILYGYS